MSPEQLAEWDEFFRLEPAGYPAERGNAGLIAAMALNAAPFRGPDAKVYTAEMFDFDRAERDGKEPPAPPKPPVVERASPYAEAVLARAVASMYGGTVVEVPG